jgi:peptidoglycan-N-acetylglucosamine deacetylase
MRNCLTVDVEEWFHICGVGPRLAPGAWDALPARVVPTTRELLVLLDRYNVRATFFVLGWVADRYPRLVQEIAGAGHEIGSHGHRHTRVYEMTADEFARDIDASRSALAAAGVSRVVGFRAPEWSINDRSLWALDVLTDKGFSFDSSMAPLRMVGNPGYPRTAHTRATARGTLVEFPPLVGRRFGQNIPLGGGWGLRMADPADLLGAIDDLNDAGQSVTLWVHPWEFDDDPPRVRLPWRQRFAHYFRLRGFKERFEQIVAGAAFCPMGELLTDA